MSAAQPHPVAPEGPGGRRPAATTAELSGSMLSRYGDQLGAEAIARIVRDVLRERGLHGVALVPRAVARTVERRVRRAMYALDPALRPPRSDRAEAIAAALAGGRA